MTLRDDAPLIITLISIAITAIISFLAFRIARTIERRRIVLEFLRELNSTEMMRDRHNAVLALRKFSENPTGAQAFEREVWSFLVDSSHLEWSPGCGYSHFGRGHDKQPVLIDAARDDRNEEEFVRSHGLANFIYFIARVQICCDKNLLDQRLADLFLYSWFLHYYAFLAHFAKALQDQVNDHAPVHRHLQAGWIEGINSAVRRMENLSGVHNPTHSDRPSRPMQVHRFMHDLWLTLRNGRVRSPATVERSPRSAAPAANAEKMLPNSERVRSSRKKRGGKPARR
ncbi:hypothetical protein [Longimicrobium sp.]|uniref:hypothetical protein n=1 Tax=Longimicrobium sp. TaxID=2029185 RepID=UPI002EDAE759